MSFYENVKNFRLEIVKTLFFIREYFFPTGCALCSRGLVSLSETWYGLCEPCHAGIAAEPGKNCDLCGRPLVSEQSRCLSCRNTGERSYDRVTVLFPYTGKYRRLLAAYKFGRNIAVGNYFSDKILKIIGSCAAAPENAVIVPVPPRPGKIKQKGWDQIEFLTRLLERGGKAFPIIKICRCLERLRSGVQKELGRDDRMRNLKGRIIPKGKTPKTALLIDDVMTTGATLDVCAEALKKGGTEKVYCLCLFYD
ncbi:MAG: ComF family protein [Treponema sp.]|nr:ComF family protein [Treponema sp.]